MMLNLAMPSGLWLHIKKKQQISKLGGGGGGGGEGVIAQLLQRKHVVCQIGW